MGLWGFGRGIGGLIGTPGLEGGRMGGGRPCPGIPPIEGRDVANVVMGEGLTGR